MIEVNIYDLLDYSKRPKDDARKDGQDSRTCVGQSTIAYLNSVMCNDIDRHALYRHAQ